MNRISDVQRTEPVEAPQGWYASRGIPSYCRGSVDPLFGISLNNERGKSPRRLR